MALLMIMPFFYGSRIGAATDLKPGTVTGRVLVKGGTPLSWGEIMLYDAAAGPPPMPEKYDRIPDIIRIIDADGMFKVDMPPGRYYLGAIKRMSGERSGPPREGDYVVKDRDAKGRPKEYIVKPGQLYDIGTISGAVPLRTQDISERAVTTAIIGKVTDTEGKPVANAVVLAFVSPAPKGRPLFLSEKTDSDGAYVLRLTAGTYYLRVRDSSQNGPPEPGQIVGSYGEGTPAPVVVKEGGIVKGIDFRVVLFGGRGPQSGTVP